MDPMDEFPYSLNSYILMLEEALKTGYEFLTFKELNCELYSNANRTSNSGKVLLRHDIDGDIEAALKMASIENELEIRSTYFLMLRSPCYNLLSRTNVSAICKIS